MLLCRLLNEFLHWRLPISSSNYFCQCLCLLGQSLQLLSVYLGTVLGLLSTVTVCVCLREPLKSLLSPYLGPLFWSSLLVCSISPLSALVGDTRIWGQSGVCSLQDLINGMWGLEQPTRRKLAYCLTREAEASGGETQGFASVQRALRVPL